MATKIAYYPTHRNEDLLDKETQYLIHGSNFYSGVRRTINLLVQADGTVVDQGGEITQDRGLNLGNQGDHLVTLIHFDTHELQWGETDPEHGDNTEGIYLLEHEYEPVIHFYNPDKEYGELNPISFKFEGGDFFVPQELTKNFGKYQIIYSLREQIDKGATPGNVGEESESLYREVFISNTFFGEVKETLFSNDNFSSWINSTALNERQETLYLKKPSVEIGINYETKEIVISNDGLEWGNLQDNLMTDIRIHLAKWSAHLGGDWNSDSSFYLVFVPDEEGFNSGLQTQSVKLKYDAGLDSTDEDDAFYTYIPSVVTQNSNKWGAQLFAKPKQDELSYYNFTLPIIDYSYSADINMDWMSNNGLVHITRVGFRPNSTLNGKKYWYAYDSDSVWYYLGEPGETIKLRSWNFGTNTNILGEPENAVTPQYFFAEPFEIQVKSNFLQQEDINPDEEQNIVDIPENALYDTYRFALTGRSSDENNPDASEFIITNEEFSYQLEQTGYQIQELLNWVDNSRGWVIQDELATKQELNILDNKYKEATTVEFSEDIEPYYYKVGDNLSGQYIKSDKISEVAWHVALKTKNGSVISQSPEDGGWYFKIVYLDENYEEIGISPWSLFDYKFPWTEDDSYEITEIGDAAAFNTNILYSRVSIKENIIQLNEGQTENSNKIQELNEFTNYVEENYAKNDYVETLNQETKEEIINTIIDAGEEEWSRAVGDFQAQSDTTIFLRVTQENVTQEIFTREGQKIYWYELSGVLAITDLVNASFVEPQYYGLDGDARIFSFTTPQAWEGESLSCTQNDIAYVVNNSGIALKNYYNKKHIDENQSYIWKALSNIEAQVDGKQDQLVSGTNIKTVNGQSLLGEGNISIEGGGGGGEIPADVEKRLSEVEVDIRFLQQGLDGTLSIANSASQTATATANNFSDFTSYAEGNYATKIELKNNHYTKAEVDALISSSGSGSGNDEYEYVRDDSLVYLVGDSETGRCQTLYIKEGSKGYAKDFLGIFGGEYDIWFFEDGILSIDGVDDFECQQVNDTVWSVNLPAGLNGAPISPNDTNLNAYFVKQVEVSSGSIKLTDLR